MMEDIESSFRFVACLCGVALMLLLTIALITLGYNVVKGDYEHTSDYENESVAVVEDRDITVNNDAETIVNNYYEADNITNNYYEAEKVSYVVPVTIFVILLFVCVIVACIIIHCRWKAKYTERILSTSLHTLATEKSEVELELLNKYK